MILQLRSYQSCDAAAVLSWSQDERSFYQWTAGVMGDYPLREEQFGFVEKLKPFVAYDETGPVGFLTLRQPGESTDELRMGFVIIAPEKRGKGYGKELVRLGVREAFSQNGIKKVSLGVFDNNPAAYACYRAVGFVDVTAEPLETYSVLGEQWNCRELEITSGNESEEKHYVHACSCL